MTDMIFKQINNVQLKWAFLAQPNTKGNYPSNKYEVVLVLNKEQLEQFVSLPHSPKQKAKDMGDGTWELKLKRAPKDGKNPIKIVDRNQIVMPTETVAKIGNGTIATVKLYSYKTQYGDFVGISAIKVNELKEYSADGKGQSFDDDGYAAVAQEFDVETSEAAPF